jgi:hypothetical protein
LLSGRHRIEGAATGKIGPAVGPGAGFRYGARDLEEGIGKGEDDGAFAELSRGEDDYPPRIPASAFATPGNKMLRPVIDPFGMRKAA